MEQDYICQEYMENEQLLRSWLPHSWWQTTRVRKRIVGIYCSSKMNNLLHITQTTKTFL